MEKGGKPVLTPKLRFPEFREAPGWEEILLKDVLTEHKLKSDGKSEVHSVSVHKGVINQKQHLGRSYAAADTSNYSLAQPYDIIYTKSPTGDFPFGCVKQNKLRSNVIVSPLYGVFEPTNRHLGYILDAYFESPIRTNNFLAPIIQKGAKNTIQITNETFLSKGLYLPLNTTEQQKIAKCLSSLDVLIGAHIQKLNALRDDKRGLVQQLFPTESETLPRLRFPEFQGSTAWTRSSVTELVEAGCLYPPRDGNHGNLHPKSSDYVANGIPFIMASDLNNGQIDISNCHFISKELADTLQKGFAKEGDVLLSHKGTVGEVAVVKRIETPYVMLTPQVTYYRVRDRTRLSNLFLAQLFVSDEFQRNLGIAAGGGTRSYIGITEQRKLSVTLPKNRAEQQRIADCLTSLDEVVMGQRQKVDALKALKEGLMQQLFPSREKFEA